MTGLISAGADLAGTIVTALYYAALGIGAFCLLLWTLAALGAWLAARAERKRAQARLDEDTLAMIDAWKDTPGIIPDALDAELAQWLREGERDA